MNIFYLDENPEVAAQMHCDKHVVKMILESAQMLSTAHRVIDGEVVGDSKGLYKTAHKNHPSTIWTRTNNENYEWLWTLMYALMKEYGRRYKKHHATERLVHLLWEHPINITQGEFTPPPQCMPDYCKDNNSTVQAYRNFYILEKSRFAEWKYSKPPKWFNEEHIIHFNNQKQPHIIDVMA